MRERVPVPGPRGRFPRGHTIANIIGPGAQGITATEFAELVAAIRAGLAYVNVHSTTFPGGEVRGQLNGIRNLIPYGH